MPEQPAQFGPELRRLRLAAGLSLTRLGELVHYSKSQLSKVERGIKPPSAQLARLCDAVLETEVPLASLVSAESQEVQLPGIDDGGEVWLMQLSASGPSWFQPISRRQAVATGAASVVGLGIGTPHTSAAVAGKTLLEGASALFDQYRRLGQATSPEVVLPALIAQTHTLRELAEGTGVGNRKSLLTLASRYAEYIGWLVQETGNDRGALWWTDRAVELADAGGDHDLAAYALVRRALVTFYRNDAEQTIQLAAQAQSSGLPPRIRGLAAQREAQGHALAGDYTACMRCLDRARVFLTQEAPGTSGPVIGTTNLSDPVAMVTGWCLHDLGRPQRAAETIDREIAQVPAHAARSRARYGVRRALAHAMAGEIDHSCALAGELLGTTEAVGSATIRADLKRLAQTLARHPRNPSVRKLAPQLAAALFNPAQ